MRKSLSVLIALCGSCLLAVCNGGGGNTPPPQATHFAIAAPAAGTTGTAFQFTVTALDASNNVVAGYTGTVHFTSTDNQAVLPANSKLTNGTATFSATLKTIGSQTIMASDTVAPSITGPSNSITVTGPATHFSVAAPVAATTAKAFNFGVNALDAANNIATSYSGTVHFTSTDSQAALPANSMLTNGTVSLSATLKIVGSQTITASDTVTASITGTSNAISVGSAAATHFSVNAFHTARAGVAFNFQVTALDAANNTASTYPGTVHFTSTDPMAVLPANSTLANGTAAFSATLKTIGSQTITATDTVAASITGTSNSITVFNGLCLMQGEQCPQSGPPCCPGLECVALGNRHFCQPVPQAFRFPSRFTAACTMDSPRDSHTATLLNNGLVLFTGGELRAASLATAELFNPDTRTFAPTGNMADARARHTATLLPSGSVLVVGGRDASGNSLATAEIFDPFRGGFASAGKLSVPRESHTATLLSHGLILITGGSNGPATLAAAELFDSTRESFEPIGRMTSPRAFHTATLLKDGRVLVTGGRNADGNVLATAELFDPATGRFTPASGMTTPRELHTATLLSDGTVFITGGDDGTMSLATAELFDPAKVSFTPTESMHTPRDFHTATLRKDGTVLVAGGASFASVGGGSPRTGILPEVTATAELFDPARGSFIPVGEMANARAKQTATLLPGGEVLVTGGIGANNSDQASPNAPAELFQ
jgi:hypothetical protein